MHAATPLQAAAQPISTLDELLAWAPGSLPNEELCVGSVPLASQARPDGPPRPKLLVCHDHRGGYGEDRWALGGTDSEAYRLNAWHCIDTFVYFSHHLVTIPPPGWINAAHRNGVPVLGTFITEWDAGAATCASAFCSMAAAEEVAERLAAIAARYGFEGWLVNIENPMRRDHLVRLRHFLRRLRLRLRAQNPSAQLIWYDAVTIDGALQWQDTLNAANRPFFEDCDGIFVNYTWKADTPVRTALEARPRGTDVYMGIDVFGRGTYGGGGATCDVAIRAAFDAGLSAALFAPGWVHECPDAGPYAGLPSFEDRQQAFWDRIEACCGDTAAAHRVLPLPFWSDFDCGCGADSPRAGEGSARTWFDLSRQTVQPRWQRRRHVVPGLPAAAHLESQALRAGSPGGHGGVTSACMRVSGAAPPQCAAIVGELFRLNAPLGEGGLRVNALLRQTRCRLALRLLLRRAGDGDTAVLLTADDDDDAGLWAALDATASPLALRIDADDVRPLGGMRQADSPNAEERSGNLSRKGEPKREPSDSSAECSAGRPAHHAGLMATGPEPTAADWLDCGWDVPAAAVQHRTLLGVQLCCASDPASATAGISEGNPGSIVSFQGDIGELRIMSSMEEPLEPAQLHAELAAKLAALQSCND